MAKKRKEPVYEHGKHQTSQVHVSIKSVLWTKEFQFGVQDAVAGKPFRREYDRWSQNKQWNYERGRIYGICTRGEIPVKYGKEVNSHAIRAVSSLAADKIII